MTPEQISKAMDFLDPGPQYIFKQYLITIPLFIYCSILFPLTPDVGVNALVQVDPGGGSMLDIEGNELVSSDDDKVGVIVGENQDHSSGVGISSSTSGSSVSDGVVSDDSLSISKDDPVSFLDAVASSFSKAFSVDIKNGTGEGIMADQLPETYGLMDKRNIELRRKKRAQKLEKNKAQGKVGGRVIKKKHI